MPHQSDDLLYERYRIQEIIAEGGMGAIYRAFDQMLHIEVALKENYRNADQFARQFQREAALLAGLNHPNLPRVTDHFISPDGGQYLVMDYVAGLDLRQILAQQTRLAEAEVVRIGVAVSAALQYLHTRQPAIIHRDIKPGNIKITPDGQVFLVDFGLAKQSSGDEATAAGAQALTPGYAPPEQYGQGTDPRSDIYALGATLYAALTGQIPEDGLARAMGAAYLAPVRIHAPQVSIHTAQAVEKAMSVRPDDRFSSAAEFRAALLGETTPVAAITTGQPVLNGAPVSASTAASARPPHPVSVSAPVPVRKPLRIALWAGLGGTGILGFVLILFMFLSGQGRDLPNLAVVSPSIPSLSPTLSPSAAPATSVPTASSPTPTAENTLAPEQPSPTPQPLAPTATPRGGSARLAFASDRGGNPQIWVISPDSGQLEQITRLADGACQPDWSPDGQRIVFTSPCSGRDKNYPGSSLFIIRADGTELVPLASLPGGDYDPDWSPDGSRIAFTSLRGGIPNIYIYDLAVNQAWLLSNPVNYDSRPSWSPDGLWIAYESTLTGTDQIWVMDTAGKQKSEFSPAASGISSMPSWAPDNSAIFYTQGGDLPILLSRAFPAKGNPEVRLAETINGIEDASVSPDGELLALTVFDRSGACDVYILARSDNAITPLTDVPGADFDPDWQP